MQYAGMDDGTTLAGALQQAPMAAMTGAYLHA
jgi:hypothetical protein